MSAPSRLPRLPIAVLGIMTILAYGSWFYGFGVLIAPIAEDTGWSDSTLGIAFGLSILMTGLGGAIAGRSLDSRGTRRTYVALALVAGAAVGGASVARNPVAFAALAAVGGGAIGAGGYYNASTAIVARLVPDRRTSAITAITLFGAFASLSLPLLAKVVLAVGWRATLAGIGAVLLASFLSVSVLLPDVHPAAEERPSLREAITSTVRPGTRRRLVLASLTGGAAMALLLVQQVPVMVDAGMALATASAIAGARGILQVFGRLPLPAIVRRFGARATVRATFALTSLSALLLVGAGTIARGVAYAVVAGLAIGAFAAADGIYSAEIYEGPSLGTNLGTLALLRGLGSATGPVIGGVLVDVTGGRTAALIFVAICAAASTITLARGSTRADQERA